MPLHKDIFPFRGPHKKAPRVDLIEPYGFIDSKIYQVEMQRASQSSPAISAQSRSSSQTAYYNYHTEEHDAVSRMDTPSVIESTYSLVSTAECATARAEESEAEKSAGSTGKGFHLPKFKLSLSPPPPKHKPKRPPTPRSAVSFGRGGAGNSFRASANVSPTTPTTARRHKASNSDPAADRLSMLTDRTETTDCTSDGGTYTPPRRGGLDTRASRWSLEPLRDQAAASRSSLESEWVGNGGLGHRHYAPPSEIPTSTGFAGMRALARSFPVIPPDAGRPRWEEQRQEGRNSLGQVVSPFRPGSATELGEFSRTSGDPHIMRSTGSLDLDQHGAPFPFATSPHNPPPSYDEATDRLTTLYGPRDRRHLDDPRVYPPHAAYDAPLHQQTCHMARPLPAIPRRYDRGTTPLEPEPVYPDHPGSKEGHLPWHRPSMKKPAVDFSAASECTKERPSSRLSTTHYTNKQLYRQDAASPEPCPACACHLDDRPRPGSRALDAHPDESDTTPHHPVGRHQHRPTTPIADPAPACPAQPEPSAPDQAADTEPAAASSVVTTSAPSPSLEPDRTGDGAQETHPPPKQLSKIERALLRRQRS